MITNRHVLVTLLLAAGCATDDYGSDPSEQDDQDSAQTTESPLYSYNDSHTWPIHDIPVCWDSTTWNTAKYRTFMTEVQNMVENTYGRVTDLRFLGWGKCGTNLKATIRIFLDDGSGGQTDSNYHATLPTDLHCGTAPENAVNWDPHAVFLHEFGHALGFDHEIDRPDAFQPCLANPITHAGTTYTPYDNDSVLNSTYCFERFDLSPWDVVGLQKVYGVKSVGSLVGANNKCADVDNPGAGQPGGATRLQGWHCLGNANQSFSYDKSQRLRASNFTWGYMDVQWANSTNGTPVWNWSDNPGPAQSWSFNQTQIVGKGDLCLAVDSWAAGQSFHYMPCDPNNTAQRFTVNPWGNYSKVTMRSPSGQTFCMSLSHTSATIENCATTVGQTLTAWNRRIYSQDNYCMSGEAVSNHALVGTTPCSFSSYVPGQSWKLRGPIHGLAGKCLDVANNGGVHAGSSLQLWDCLGTTNQSWEFHF